MRWCAAVARPLATLDTVGGDIGWLDPKAGCPLNSTGPLRQKGVRDTPHLYTARLFYVGAGPDRPERGPLSLLSSERSIRFNIPTPAVHHRPTHWAGEPDTRDGGRGARLAVGVAGTAAADMPGTAG